MADYVIRSMAFGVYRKLNRKVGRNNIKRDEFENEFRPRVALLGILMVHGRMFQISKWAWAKNSIVSKWQTLLGIPCSRPNILIRDFVTPRIVTKNTLLHFHFLHFLRNWGFYKRESQKKQEQMSRGRSAFYPHSANTSGHDVMTE